MEEKRRMAYVYLGKIVNTHGIKGEIRILSDFEKKEIVWKPGFVLYIGKEKRKERIESYRHHKNFEMIRYQGVTNINEVLKDIGASVYIKREDLKLKEDDYLLEDLIGYEIIEETKKIGKIIDIVYNKAGILLEAVSEKGQKFYIPKNDYFIKQVNILLHQIETQNAKGLIL